jgi:FkbM family methyltransferase
MRRPVSGVLVEPIPWLFEQLKGNYEDKPGLRFLNAAIGRESGSRTLYFIRSRAGDPVWADLLGSFHREVVLSHRAELPDVEERLESIVVPCCTLESVVSEHGFRRLDLIHVDAEGSDYEVLQSIDLNGPLAPRFLLFEQKHLGADRDNALALVENAGYRILDLGMDILAARRRSPLAKRKWRA